MDYDIIDVFAHVLIRVLIDQTKYPSDSASAASDKVNGLFDFIIDFSNVVDYVTVPALLQ